MHKLFRLTWGLFLIILFFSCGFAQEKDKSLTENRQQAQEELSVSPDNQEKPRLITAIDIVGNKMISSNTIISKMKSRIGSPYQENIISDDLKRLYLLGYFGDIKIDTQDYKGGVKIVITVTERPVIEKISFIGIVRLNMREEKIKEMLKSREGQYLDYPSLSEDIETIKGLYEKIGYSNALVDYEIDIDKEKNKANLEFIINEGKKVTIKNIFVEGNKFYSDSRILRLMKTKRGWLFNAGVLKEDVLAEDIERIKAFYRNNGFNDVEVDYKVSRDEKRPYWLYITININEGQRYLVGDVIIQGNKDIAQKDILSKISECLPGKVFSEIGLRQDIANIQSLYFDKGYISMQIQETTSLNPRSKRIDILYSIVENQIAYVDKIKVRGNVKTKDIVIRRELRIYPGDKFDGEKLKRSKERLQNLGFFEEISYDTEETAEANKKDLIVDVKESKTGAFSFGGGYSTVDQFVGFVEIEQKNFDWKNWPYFTGAGQDLKFRASFGSITSGYDISFTEPWLFDYPVSFGFDAYKREHKRDEDVGYGYDEKITGGDLRLGKELSEYLYGNITYRYDSITIGSVTEDASDDLKQEAGTNKISSFTFGLTYDSRDNIYDTSKGNVLAGSLEWAGGPLGADKNFWKFYGRASHYLPLMRGSVLEFRGRLGLADPYGNTDRIPIYERFFAGGAATIRGYHERKVGPIDPISKDPLGGDAMIIGNIEYLYPIFDFFKVAAFYDVGNVWNDISKINTGGYKMGVGFGVRVKTPIGPLMLDYGIPLNKEPGEEKRGGGRFHFSMSHGF